MANWSLLVAVCLCLPALLTTSLAARNCTEDSDCGPMAGVCNETDLCECNSTLPEDCFALNSSGYCVLQRCYEYVGGEEVCRLGRFSRTIALVLSIFLINFGAANFYIQFYALAAPQIILGLLLCVFQFGSCGASCTRKEKDSTSMLCIFCCVCNSIVSLSVFVWWLVDLILIATNNRLDGRGCPLYT